MTAQDEEAHLQAKVRLLEHELRQLKLRHEALTKLVASQERRGMELEAWLRRLDPDHKPTKRWEALEDGRPGTCLNHKPVQHRDRQPPWCKECGRTEEGRLIRAPRGAAPVMVGVEHHQFVGPGPDGRCDGTLGYARGEPRHGERCGAGPLASIHSLPPGWKSWTQLH